MELAGDKYYLAAASATMAKVIFMTLTPRLSPLTENLNKKLFLIVESELEFNI
jgi:hypothetical protein